MTVMPLPACRSATIMLRLQQYVGRLHRLHDSKRLVQVYDYVDANVRMLARMYDRRLKGYSARGYKFADGVPEQQSLIPLARAAAR